MSNTHSAEICRYNAHSKKKIQKLNTYLRVFFFYFEGF